MVIERDLACVANHPTMNPYVKLWLAEKLGQPATTSVEERGRDSGNNDSLTHTGDRLNGATAVEWHSNVFETSIMALKMPKKLRLRGCYDGIEIASS